MPRKIFSAICPAYFGHEAVTFTASYPDIDTVAGGRQSSSRNCSRTGFNTGCCIGVLARRPLSVRTPRVRRLFRSPGRSVSTVSEATASRKQRIRAAEVPAPLPPVLALLHISLRARFRASGIGAWCRQERSRCRAKPSPREWRRERSFTLVRCTSGTLCVLSQ